MALTVQNLRAVGTGVEPASLLPGQLCFNITDKVIYVGDGSSVKTAFDGTQVPGVPGEGWYAMPMDFAALNEYYVANPGFYGDTPTDQQVLTWSTVLNHPIWTNGGGSGGGNQVYVVTNADVAAAAGATTSDKITAAIGVASPDEGDVTIVTGLPDDVYEGLYFFTTEWIKGASYAYPSASEVIYDNTAHPTLTPTVQGAISDLDDGLAATTAIANTANSTATSALSIANAALPKAGGTMTGTIIARNIDIQAGYTLQFAGGVNGTVTGISSATSSTSTTTAASSAAVNAAYLLAQAALPYAGGVMTGPISFVAGQTFPISGIDIASTSQLGVVEIGSNIDVTAGGVISVKTASTSDLGLVQVGSNIDVAAGVISIANSSTTNKGLVQLNDTFVSTSTTEAATANALRASYSLAAAAVPRSSYTADGDILVGTAPGTFGALGVGTEGQVLSVFGGVPAWVDDVPGDVTGVTGVAPIVVDNTDPENPIVKINEATTADPGVVQIDITGNINIAGGVITVPNASTTVRGAVQLNNTLSSTSTTEALTAAQGYALQQQITTLNLTNSVILAGGYDATTGLVDGVTAQGTAASFVDGAAPPVAGPGNVDHYLICTTAGNNPSAMENGDWLLSSETSPGVYAYVVLGVGARPATASYTQAGVVQLADGAAVLAGTSDATAITPQALQDNVVDSVTTSNSNLIASATAVKIANDNALAAQSTANNALSVANAALPKAGGTMTGPISAHNIDIQSGFSLQFAGGINGSLDGITDSTATTDSTIAASATAVKSAYDLANAALPKAGGTMTGDITLSGAGVGVVFNDASTVEAISDSVALTSSVTAASSTAVKAAYDAGAAAIPCSLITAVGDIVVGGAGPAPTALPVGTDGQVLVANSACAAGLEWVTDVPGDVTSVTGTTPIQVDNLDPQNPVVSIDAASTTQAGAVQLNDTVTSTSTTEAATANAAKTAYDEAVIACGIAQAAVPCASFTTTGELLAGTGTGTYSALTVGTNGQVLLANSACSTGLEWGNACYVPDACFTAAGQLIVGTGTGTYVALSPGTNGQLLVPNSACANGVEWVTCSSLSLCGYTCVATPFNTALGFQAGDSITTGTGNTSIGFCAGTALTSGNGNTVVGRNAGLSVTGIANLTAIGVNSVTTAATGAGTTAVGANTLAILSSGAQNTAVGSFAGTAVTTGGCNTFLGAGSGSAVNSGSNNTFLGYLAGDAATSASSNVFIGSNAGSIATIGSQNIFIGVNAGDGVTTGFNNTIIGDISGTAALTDTLILGTGTTVRFQANASGAWSPDGTNFGTIGQVLTSNGTVAAPSWCTLSLACVPCSAFTGVGAILAGTGSGTFTALPVGTNGQVLVPNSSCAAGLEWITTGALCLQGYSCSATPFNTALGALAGDSITSGTNNSSFGYNAGTGVTTGSFNVAFGSGAGTGITVQDGHVAIGYQTLVGALDINNSNLTAIGTCALRAVTTGQNNIGIGHCAGALITTGGCNIAIGARALDSVTTTANNIGIGFSALTNITSGSENLGIGTCAGQANTTGSNNTSVGYFAGCATTANGNNTYLGAYAGRAQTSTNNTAVGACALANSGVNNNTGIGFNAGAALTTGGSNTFVGAGAGDAATTADNSVAIGFNALGGVATAAGNVAIGVNALVANTGGDNSVAVGFNAGAANTTGAQNVLVGTGAGQTSNAVGVTAVGFCAGQANSTSGCVTYLGWTAGRNATGLSNTYVGALTGCAASNTSACGTLLGFCAGSALTTGNGNTLLGMQAGRFVTTGGFNVAIGPASLQTATTAANNVAIGCGALAGLTTSCGNTAIGHRAMLNASTAFNNVAVGLNAGEQISTGSNNTFVGTCTGDTVTTGTQNTFIGAGSGGLVATTSEGNTGLGFNALGGGVTSGAYNVALGNNAGLSVTSGAINTLVGYSAGSAITTGGSNTIIGRYAGTATLSNNIVLSDGAGTIRFQANSSGAWSPDGINFGTAGQVLQSAGTAAAPTWTTPVWQPLTTLTTTSTTTTTLLSVPVASTRAVFIDLSISDVTGGNYHTDSYQVVTDGTATDDQQIPGARLGTNPYTLTSAVVGANLVISVTSTSANSTKYVGSYQTIAV